MISGWFDIHSHALPKIDDGAVDIEMTEKMLRLAFAEGTRHMIFTPHYRTGRFEADTALLKTQFEQVFNIAKQIVPEMTLYLGNELFFSSNLIAMLKNKKVLTLADSSYILVEFAYGQDYPFIQWAVEQLQSEGYKVILAHFERYHCLKNRLDRLRELLRDKVYLQITASYAAEMTRKAFPNYIKKAFQEHLIHFIGTDSHNPTSRSPIIRKSIIWLCKKYGEDYIRTIVLENPKKIILNKYI